MTFVDTNVFVYAVGREHPHRDRAQAFFAAAAARRTPLVSSAEVLQELLHVYLPVRRFDALDRALQLARASLAEVWSLEEEDVVLARSLADRHPDLSARDLVHLASCSRRRVRRVQTFDRKLRAAFG